MKPAAPPVLRATRLLDQVRERISYRHYSLRTEQAYVQWVRMFMKWLRIPMKSASESDSNLPHSPIQTWPRLPTQTSQLGATSHLLAY